MTQAPSCVLCGNRSSELKRSKHCVLPNNRSSKLKGHSAHSKQLSARWYQIGVMSWLFCDEKESTDGGCSKPVSGVMARMLLCVVVAVNTEQGASR